MSTTKARADSLSLLLFTLRSGKLMAINLLKVSEIIPCPPLTKLPAKKPLPAPTMQLCWPLLEQAGGAPSVPALAPAATPVAPAAPAAARQAPVTTAPVR